MKKKKKKPTAIDKAIILLKDIRKNGTGRTFALSKKYGFHKNTVSRVLITLMKQGLFDRHPPHFYSALSNPGLVIFQGEVQKHPTIILLITIAG